VFPNELKDLILSYPFIGFVISVSSYLSTVFFWNYLVNVSAKLGIFLNLLKSKSYLGYQLFKDYIEEDKLTGFVSTSGVSSFISGRYTPIFGRYIPPCYIFLIIFLTITYII
jgi:hypothetical protein